MKRRILGRLSIALLLAAGAVTAPSGATEPPANPVAIPFQLQTPVNGVRLTGGILKQVFDNHIIGTGINGFSF